MAPPELYPGDSSCPLGRQAPAPGSLMLPCFPNLLTEQNTNSRSKEKQRSYKLELEARSLVETDANGIRSGRKQVSLYTEVDKQRWQ